MRFGGSPFSGERSPNRIEALPAVSNAPSALPTSPEVGGILEEDVEFDDATGHDHTGAGGTGTPIPLAGDVTGDNTAAVVVGLQTKALDAPATDLTYPYYDLASDSVKWGPIAPGGGACQIGEWFRSDISAAPTTAAEMTSLEGSFPLGIMPIEDGKVIGLGVMLSGDLGAAGNSYELDLYIDGVYTGQSVVINGTAGTDRKAINISFSLPVTRGTSEITLYEKRTGTLAAVKARAWVLLSFDVDAAAGTTRVNVADHAVTIPSTGVSYRMTLTFSADGVFDDRCYSAQCTSDEVGPVIEEDQNRKTAGQCAWIVYVPSDASAGTYGTNLNLLLSPQLKGTGWTGPAGPITGVWAGPTPIL